MPRYRAILVLTDPDGEQQVIGGETIFEGDGREMVRTGLLDSSGQPLYRERAHRPIGFNLSKVRS